MKDINTIKNQLLEKIKKGEISPVEGYKLLKKLENTGTADKSAVHSSPVIHENSDIAIIGMAGIYPGARNLDEFWDNLKNGRDGVTEIPADRWDVDRYFDPDPEKAREGKMYNKWGAFIDDVDAFDSMFFNISPNEAATIDPQERLFLQTVHHAIEDAGYTRKSIRTYVERQNAGDVGIFVGETSNTYLLHGSKGLLNGNAVIPTSFPWSIANRVSYFFDFHGPSMPVDTACSSSLTALHIASESIKKGECSMAIVGGVNLYLHPIKYIWLCQMTMLSKKGRCHTFGIDADGFCPGEGVGAVILKPLDYAIRDNDHIYAVLKGTSVNHDGKTTGYTVPNPNAQADLIRQALNSANIDARTISHIEAHGTGTKLGDPIEIIGLTKAFQEYTRDTNYCAISSSKSNIGHLESAAGITGLIKIILEMKHRQLVPSLHSQTLNPEIDFSTTPFYVQHTLSPWEQPVINGNTYPRRAGVSSFGAGGVNAHAIIEDYTIPDKAAVSSDESQLFILSAKDKERLDAYIDRYIDFIDNNPDTSLHDMCYTMMTGREQMEERLAIIASSIKQVREKLKAAKHGASEVIGVYRANIKRFSNQLSTLQPDKHTLNKYITGRNLAELSKLWTKGITINWNDFVKDKGGMTIHLPFYPFTEERHWIPQIEDGYAQESLDEYRKEVPSPVSEIKDRHELSQPVDEMEIEDNLRLLTGNYLKQMISNVTGVDISKIDPDEPFETFGIDSIMITRFNNYLSKSFTNMSMTLFYECQNTLELLEYFIEFHNEELEKLFSDSSSRQRTLFTHEIIKKAPQKQAVPKITGSTKVSASHNNDIAIIGVAGRYPNANNIDEYWDNLKSGKDCISEIPAERWRWQDYYDPDTKKSADGKIYGKWGGFINDIDKFDPFFFGITPADAELMDPQERLFLEMVWETLEDAGYTKTTINKQIADDNKTGVGVFAGVTTYTYNLFGPYEWLKHNYIIPDASPWNIANKVSYLFNFQGPSLPVDTACSSSLTAIHMACESIINGKSGLAIAGGVNLYLHPSKYLKLCQMNMLSPTGRCHTFGNEADGFVPGEGVGAILLKSLDDAVRDNDNIYAVIKGSAINHDGKTNGYTVPNPNAQTAIIEQSLAQANIDARTISLIEAHGTGTKLGDPIEITALTKAFKKYTNDTGFCAISSSKSNIGHLEAAAGIAGITKIILQMKHKQLAPSLHCDTVNSNINFSLTPFTIQRRLETWQRPQIDGQEYPRRAGISSFGAGGTNAHLIVEEYTAQEIVTDDSPAPQLFILSAKNKTQLKEYAKKYVSFLKKINTDNEMNISLTNIAYTLLVGREALPERLAFIASTIEDLSNKLEEYLKNTSSASGVFTGSAKKGSTNQNDAHYAHLLEVHDLTGIAEAWVNGASFNWKLLYQAPLPSRISLPTYPFVKKSCWLEQSTTPLAAPTSQIPARSIIHPLLDENISTLYGFKFSKTLTGKEFYLTDHIINEQKILPGVTYLEMARSAATIIGEGNVQRIEKIVWSQPIIATDNNKQIYISLKPNDNTFTYEIKSDDDELAHSSGRIVMRSATGVEEKTSLDVRDIIKRCTITKSKTECYDLFKQMGFNYGTGFQGITSLHYNETEVLSELTVPQELRHSLQEFLLHPTIMDGALQSIIGLVTMQNNILSTIVPFEIASIEIKTDRLPEQCYAYIVESHHSKATIKRYNITIVDSDGTILVTIMDFSVRKLKSEKPIPSNETKTETDDSSSGDTNIETDDISALLKRVENGDLDYNEAYKIMEGLND